MRNRSLAMRYAKALFDLAKAKKVEPAIESDLKAFASSFQESRQHALFFETPVITIDEKKEMLAKRLGGKAAPLTIQFLMLLIVNRRFDLLDAIAQAYHELMNESAGVEEIAITSAHPLTAALKEKIETAVRTKLNRKVVSETTIDPSLLGGVRIQVRNRLFDGSIRTQLDLLKKEMMGTAHH